MRLISEMGKISKVVVGRILPGEDVITGIEEICKKHDIKYGIITACFGSLEKIHFNYYFEPKDINKNPFGNERDLILEKPCVFIGAQGLICEELDGKIDVHLHGVVRDNNGKVYGSHIPKGGNIVQYTVEVAIEVISNMKLMRIYDEETKHLMTKPMEEK